MHKHQTTKILHITPHLGTGVGTVVLNYLIKVSKDRHFEHNIICLDYANDKATQTARQYGFKLQGNMAKNIDTMLDLIHKADIVLVHWWNHPLLYDFLVRENLPPSRIIFWSHVLGSVPPNNFTDKLLKYPEIFAFTTPVSRNVKEVKKLPTNYKKRLRNIWSTGGMDRIKFIKPKKHPGFNIGYIGTVDYTKMHPDFLKICNKADIPDVKFIVVGGPNAKQLTAEAEKLGIAHKFQFTGFVTEPEKWRLLSTFDVFGYPLAPHHYGSSDQALQEGMGAGVVPVVLDNPMENYMVKDGKTGIVAKSTKGYVQALEKLYKNAKLRKQLSKNAQIYAKREFSLKKMEREWNKIFKDILKYPKKEHKWNINLARKEITPGDIFLESIGSWGKIFKKYCLAKNIKDKRLAVAKIKVLAKSPNWISKSKGTVHQYNTFLPNDPQLNKWSKLM